MKGTTIRAAQFVYLVAMAELARACARWDAMDPTELDPGGTELPPEVTQVMDEIVEGARLVVRGADCIAFLMRLSERLESDDPGPVGLALHRDTPAQFSEN